MYGSGRRPWSPVRDDPGGHPSRGIEQYLAHSSHGWATPTREQFNGWDQEHEETLRRHRANLRAPYEPEYDDNAAYFYSSNRRNRRNRDASEVSVEALDLADYARTLRRADVAQNDSYPYPPFNNTRPFSREPWSPAASPPTAPVQRVWSPPSLPYPPTASIPVERPFSALSRDTMMAPPSLVSAGTTSHSSHTNTVSLNHPMRRPFSLPADYMAPRGPAIFNAGSPPPSARAVGTGRRVPAEAMDLDYGISNPDVSSFPPWARKWYKQEEVNAKGTKGKRPDLPHSPVEDEIFGPYIHPAASQQDLGLLPWSAGQQDDQTVPGTIPDNVKEERIRMLEREFGDKGTRRGWKEGGEGEKVIGSVDEKGKLITGGPKKRITVRVLQAIFAVLTAGSGIYGALFIKLKTPAPPSGHAAAFLLYGISIVTILLLFFFFVISPLCLRRNKDSGDNLTNPAGMMVLPVNTPGQEGSKKKKRKGKDGANDAGGSVQVNLIVDPNMFGTGRGRGGPPGRYDEDDEYDENSDDGSTNPSSRRKGRRRRERWDDEEAPPPRRSIFAGLAMERAWKRARSDLKKRVALDVVLTIGWTGTFVMVLLGKRCPPGTLDGWCDAYNIATAGASVMIALFATSAFFGIRDLHQSKVSPRTRT